MTILLIASYFKGNRFIQACKQNGWRVILLASESDRHEVWAHESIDEHYFMPDVKNEWNMLDALKAVSHLARTEKFDKIVPLDDMDIEKAAFFREHLRVEGLGESQSRFFRDKLAMRMQAQKHGIRVPEFVPAIHYVTLTDFLRQTPAPWVLKPRSQAGTHGIEKFEDAELLWQAIHGLGDEQSFYLVERFVPGDIFHVDTLMHKGEIIFERAHQYRTPPLAVTSGGGMFCSVNLPFGSVEEKELMEANAQILSAMGLENGVAHTEFIRAHEDGKLYFLETAARVGGAHISDMVEYHSGINLWEEWAKIELQGEAYQLPEVKQSYGAIMIMVSPQEFPDMSAYNAPEVVWTINLKHHAGLIVLSDSFDKTATLVDDYSQRLTQDFSA